MKKDEIIAELSDIISQSSLIVHEMVEAKCVEYLEASGYSIVKKVEPSYKNVKNASDLVGLFYALVDRHYPSPVGYYRNLGKDRKLAKSMIANRMEATNISEKEAISECTLLVESLFKYADEFHFENNPTSFGIFGQEKMGWVTDKLGRILLNKEKIKLKKRRDDFEKEVIERVLKEKGEKYLRLEGI